MHSWSGDFKYFNDVGKAAEFIGDYCRKWGRINVTQTKEKYGTARVYCSFGFHSLHSITHPGYHYSQYPNWLWKLDISYISKLIGLFNPLIVKYQILVYRKAYEAAFKKWPLIKKEIISGADYPEFVSGYWEAIPLCDKHAEEIKPSARRFGGKCLVCEKEKE